jgi:hypothetical protein
MSKKKAGPRPGGKAVIATESVRQKNIFVLRGTEEWKAWLDEVALANGAPLTVTVEQAVRELAARLKCRKPPRRTP